MSINTIDNLESAASIRAKLNEMITIVNYYSSSQFVGGPTPPPSGTEGTSGTSGDGIGSPGGSSYYMLQIYDSDGGIPYPVGHNDPASACAAYPGAPKTVYYSKGAGNTNTLQLEIGDSLYVSEGGPALPSGKFFGTYQYGINRAAYVTDNGLVDNIITCA